MDKTKSQTIYFPSAPRIAATASVAGPKECAGIVGKYVDLALNDDMFGEETYEKAECKMFRYAVEKALENGNLQEKDLDLLVSGDLLNQIISASFTARDYPVPFLGVYGACSTMAESLIVAATMIDAGHADNAVAATGSHFSSAERQYRYPLELGTTRPPQSQWTVTGAGALILQAEGAPPYVTHVTTGRIADPGVTDAANMGAAMAQAAYDTLSAHFADTGRTPEDYDLIVTGDLGSIGRELVIDLFAYDGVGLASRYPDCGVMIFAAERQDVHAGGSGCGCSASVLCGYLLRRMQEGSLKNLLFCATGALLSPVSTWQGESIPGICHAVAISAERR